MRTKEDGGIQWSVEHSSRFETSKSVVLRASRRTQPDPEADEGRIPLDRPELVIDGRTIKEVKSYKYLGMQVDNQLRWNEQAQRAAANATKWLLQFRRLTRPSTGVSSKLMRRLYLSVALPKLTYGLDIWYSPPSKPAGAARNIGSVGTLKSFQKLQRLASTAITGALRSTPTDLLDAQAGILPMELALLKACHRAAVRLLTLPDTHPLHSKFRKAKTSPPQSHPGSVDSLVKLFRMHPTNMEVISPTTTDPSHTPRFKTHISRSRDQSIEDERKDEADYKVFADGSNYNGGVGAATVLYQKDHPRSVKHLKAQLGESKDHGSYEAEAAGGILAMELINNTPDTNGKSASIYIDNQAIVKASSNPRAKSGQQLLREFSSRAARSRAVIGVKWISSHSGVPGSEKADKLAKEAAEGRASRRTDLPRILRGPLPTSASVTKQHYFEHLKKAWKENWTQSPRKDRMERLDDSFPFAKYRERPDKLTLLVQVRSGHFPLNSYLHRIKKVESKQCQACQFDLGDETPTEDIEHSFIIAKHILT
jgi:ribonuclease HI